MYQIKSLDYVKSMSQKNVDTIKLNVEDDRLINVYNAYLLAKSVKKLENLNERLKYEVDIVNLALRIQEIFKDVDIIEISELEDLKKLSSLL